MNMVNGFDIDTAEGAKAYLESEGIDIEQCVKDGMEIIERTKALVLANISQQSELVCDYCNGTGWDSYPNHSTTHAVCPKCQP